MNLYLAVISVMVILLKGFSSINSPNACRSAFFANFDIEFSPMVLCCFLYVISQDFLKINHLVQNDKNIINDKILIIAKSVFV